MPDYTRMTRTPQLAQLVSELLARPSVSSENAPFDMPNEAVIDLLASWLDDLGFDCDVAELVLSRARRALAAGCDGVVSSGLEVQRLKAEIGSKLLCVTPGIRPVENRVEADQKRIMTPAAAISAGADYLVIGRPIRDAADPKAAAAAIQAEIAGAL